MALYHPMPDVELVDTQSCISWNVHELYLFQLYVAMPYIMGFTKLPALAWLMCVGSVFSSSNDSWHEMSIKAGAASAIIVFLMSFFILCYVC